MVKNFPKISIITPSFNQAHFIDKTIKGVLNQNYPNLEYIVMDGGSTDGTLEILKKYGKKIIWKSEKDTGQANAINKGLKIATGEILAYLNSDDILLPDALFKVAKFFNNNPQIKWVFGKSKIINEVDREIRHVITFYKNLFLPFVSKNLLLVINPISQPATFWKRETTDKIGLFDEKQYYCMDYDYWLRTISKFKPGFINDYLASFRIHKRAKGEINFVRHFQDELQIAKKYTKNPALILFHYFNYLSIILGYNVFRILKHD